jgi:exodeoxyribonuclease VII small subunit
MIDAQQAAPPYADWEQVAQVGEFEDALAALRSVVAQLEAGHLRLNDAVRCYEIGATLSRRCEQLLSEAELRISKLDGEGAGMETDQVPF